jgi:hypothetical protein
MIPVGHILKQAKEITHHLSQSREFPGGMRAVRFMRRPHLRNLYWLYTANFCPENLCVQKEFLSGRMIDHIKSITTKNKRVSKPDNKIEWID